VVVAEELGELDAARGVTAASGLTPAD